MPDLTPLYILGGIVFFWLIIFFTAIYMARRSLQGVGEPLAEELVATDLASANGKTPIAQAKGATSRQKAKGGAH